MCEVAGFSRAGFYRFLDPEKPAAMDMDLRAEMQKIAVEWPSYGSRRMTRELKARGWDVNRKRVQRLMREDNLLCVTKRKFVATTDSAHGLKVYPNLAASMVLTDVDQLWVADITYIRLEEEFVYLAVILDAYSRRVIGWHLGEGLDSSLTLTALRMALQERTVRPGLVHHSDRGVQYASGDYIGLLEDNGIQVRPWIIALRCSSRARWPSTPKHRQGGLRHDDSTQRRGARAITGPAQRLGDAAVGRDRAWKKWRRLGVPARRTSGCDRGSHRGRRAGVENRDCPRAQWRRPGERRFPGGAVPWRSTYRRCSNRVVGSVRECAAGATNRHRSERQPWPGDRDPDRQQ
jgi:hypothetical protein